MTNTAIVVTDLSLGSHAVVAVLPGAVDVQVEQFIELDGLDLAVMAVVVSGDEDPRALALAEARRQYPEDDEFED